MIEEASAREKGRMNVVRKSSSAKDSKQHRGYQKALCITDLLDVETFGPMEADHTNKEYRDDEENIHCRYERVAREELERNRKPSLRNFQSWKQQDGRPSDPLCWWTENEGS
jgi:hypothetical protein